MPGSETARTSKRCPAGWGEGNVPSAARGTRCLRIRSDEGLVQHAQIELRTFQELLLVHRVQERLLRPHERSTQDLVHLGPVAICSYNSPVSYHSQPPLDRSQTAPKMARLSFLPSLTRSSRSLPLSFASSCKTSFVAAKPSSPRNCSMILRMSSLICGLKIGESSSLCQPKVSAAFYLQSRKKHALLAPLARCGRRLARVGDGRRGGGGWGRL